MDEADFVALNEYLGEVRPVIDAFCTKHGFVNVDRKSLGRYPRIRIERSGTVKIWFDLWMELDKNGHHFERFRRDLPYELSAGAYLDVQDGSKYGTRFQKAIQCFSGMSFNHVGAVLGSEMQRHLPTLEEWDMEYLKENGKRIQLGS